MYAVLNLAFFSEHLLEEVLHKVDVAQIAEVVDCDQAELRKLWSLRRPNLLRVLDRVGLAEVVVLQDAGEQRAEGLVADSLGFVAQKLLVDDVGLVADFEAQSGDPSEAGGPCSPQSKHNQEQKQVWLLHGGSLF